MNSHKIAYLLRSYGVAANEALCRQIGTYLEILLAWNKKISLTAVRDPEHIVRFHFGESLFATTTVPVEKGRLADVGSGAGFPGVPLAMACPGLQVVLIEANHKKAAFLAEVKRALNLANVSIVRQRLEDVDPDAYRFNLVTARALGSHESLLGWAAEAIIESGYLVIWLGKDDAQEIVGLPGWSWSHPIKIPMSLKRVIVVGSPKRLSSSVPRGTCERVL